MDDVPVHVGAIGNFPGTIGGNRSLAFGGRAGQRFVADGFILHVCLSCFLETGYLANVSNSRLMRRPNTTSTAQK